MNSDNPELTLADQFVRETGCNVFLTGKAGTGKTTFLHDIKKSCAKRMVVTAPTGVAAINAGGVTLHSFFQMPFGPFVPGSENNIQHRFSRDKINLIKSLDLLIIDEISMVRADLLDCVDSVLRRYRRSHLPFGGLQLLLIGDLHQLAPVVKNADWKILGPYYESPYFFSSRALQKTELIPIELQRIYRQVDNNFIDLLNRVRDNRLDRESLTALNARYDAGLQDKDYEESGYITLCTHNASADAINRARLSQLAEKTRRFNAEIQGAFPEHSYPTPPTLELKVGAQVMFVRNDSSYEKRYFNGKIGGITRILGDQIWIRCPGDHEDIMVEPATWENIEYSLDQESMEVSEKKIGAFIQYPLKLAWAITIHKSQGLTFDHAVIDAQAAFTHGQVYVALSRCRTLEGMILSSPLSQHTVRTDRAVLEFTERAGKNLPTGEKLAEARIRYQQALLLDCFNFQRLQYLLGRLASLVTKNGELLRIAGGGNLSELQQQTVVDIGRVGINFGVQLKGLFTDTVLPAEDPAIVERITKASSYFGEKFTGGLAKIVPQLQVETDNKELRKQAKRLLTQLQEEVGVKTAAVRCCEKGFDNATYLKAISSAEILAKPKPAEKSSVTYLETDIEHGELYQSLKEWRTAKTREENVAAFQVMHQRPLIQIAVRLPTTIVELKKIVGIGKKLAEKYGQELVEMVLAYRKKYEINEVILPEGVHEGGEEGGEKMSASPAEQVQKVKTDSKQQSLKLFKQGRDIAGIAQVRGFTPATIEKHLAHFVASGEIPLERFVSAERQKTIEEQLLQGKKKKLSEIRAALGPGYSYGEILFVMAHLKYYAK